MKLLIHFSVNEKKTYFCLQCAQFLIDSIIFRLICSQQCNIFISHIEGPVLITGTKY